MSTVKKIRDSLIALPNNFWDFQNADVREYSHGFHQYPAIMICPISRNIIRLVKQNRSVESLLDPFVGSGTVVVEGLLANIPYVAGNDLNPMSIFMSGVKTTQIQFHVLVDTLRHIKNEVETKTYKFSNKLQSFEKYVQLELGIDCFGKNRWSENAKELFAQYVENPEVIACIPNLKNLGYWFRPKILFTLGIIKASILNISSSEVRNFFFLAFSESIRLVSNRRNGEFKMFRMPKDKLISFFPDVANIFFEVCSRNIEKMKSFNGCADKHVSKTTLSCGDTRNMQNLADNFYDLVVTSPPYGDSRTTVAYGEFSRLSLAWLDLTDSQSIMRLDRDLLGGNPEKNHVKFDLQSQTLNSTLEIIANIDQERCAYVYAFYNELNDAIAEITKKTRKGGFHFWVVGNRIVKKTKLHTDKIISELAQAHELEHVITMNRKISNKVMPSKNSPTNEQGKTLETMTNESIVVLHKPY